MKKYTYIALAIIALAPLGVFAQQMTSQTALAQILSKRVSGIKNSGYVGTFQLSYSMLENSQTYSAKLDGTFDGNVVTKNAQSIESAEGTYSLTLGVNDTLKKMAGISSESITFQVKSILEKNQTYSLYSRITSGSPYVLKMLETYGKELKIKSPLLLSWFKLPGDVTSTRSNCVGGYEGSNCGGYTKENTGVQMKYTPDQQQFIIQKFVNALDIKQDKGVEAVNSFSGRHFVLGMTAQKFKQFVIDVSTVTRPNKPITASDIQAMDKDLNDPIVNEIFQKTEFEVWLGETDGRVYKLTVNGQNINVGDIKTPVTIGYYLNINLRDLPLTYKISKPNKFIDLDTLYKKSLTEARGNARTAPVKANIAQVPLYAELYYDKVQSYSGFCYSNELNNIRKSVSQYTTLNCKDSNQGYKVYAKLSDGYFCADTNGSHGQIKTNPATSKSLMCK